MTWIPRCVAILNLMELEAVSVSVTQFVAFALDKRTFVIDLRTMPQYDPIADSRWFGRQLGARYYNSPTLTCNGRQAEELLHDLMGTGGRMRHFYGMDSIVLIHNCSHQDMHGCQIKEIGELIAKKLSRPFAVLTHDDVSGTRIPV